MNRADAVLARVREVPEGFVRAYGDVSPGAPRFAGTVLAGTQEDVPWWRIVRADGSLAKGARQRALLEAEGVPFRGEKVDMRAARIP
jgi:alkylated DNA nucleotide flippase Atl1